jgi:prevent-host-death family protein
MTDKHMGVAEVKRHFADVMGEVMHTKRRIIVERRGRPVVAIVPLDEEEEKMTPGQKLAAVIGFGGDEFDEFEKVMKEILEERHTRMPRELPAFDV